MSLEDKLREKAKNKVDSKIGSVRDDIVGQLGVSNTGEYDKIKNDTLENFKLDVKSIILNNTGELPSADVIQLRQLVAGNSPIPPPEADFENDDFKKLCIDPIADMIFPTIADLIEAFHKIYQLPSEYLDDFNLQLDGFRLNLFPNLGNRLRWKGFPNFENISIPSLEFDFAIAQAFAQFPQLILAEIMKIIDEILEAIEQALDDIIPSPLFTLGGGTAQISIYWDDLLDPLGALFDKIKQLLPILNVFDGLMGALLRDKTLADLLGFNLRNVFNGFNLDGITLADLRIGISLSDLSKLPKALADLFELDGLRYFVRLADLSIREFIEIISALGYKLQDLYLPKFVGLIKLGELGIDKIFSISIFDIVDELQFPDIMELVEDLLEKIEDFEIPGFDIPGLDIDFKFFDSINIPDLRFNLTIQAIQIEITKLVMNFMEEVIKKLVDLIEVFLGSVIDIPNIFLKIPSAQEILDLLRGEMDDLKFRMSFFLGDLTIGDLFPNLTLPLDRLGEFIRDLELPDGRILGSLTWEEFLELLPKGIKFGELKFPDGLDLSSMKNLFVNGFTLGDLSAELDAFLDWIGEALEKLTNLKIGEFPIFKLPDPILPPGFFNPEIALKQAIQYIRMSMANWKVNLILEFIKELAEKVGVGVDLANYLFSKFFKIPAICVLVPAFLFKGKELLLSDKQDLDPVDITKEEETLADNRLPTEYGVWNKPV